MDNYTQRPTLRTTLREKYDALGWLPRLVVQLAGLALAGLVAILFFLCIALAVALTPVPGSAITLRASSTTWAASSRCVIGVTQSCPEPVRLPSAALSEGDQSHGRERPKRQRGGLDRLDRGIVEVEVGDDEIQGTAEGEPFSQEMLLALLDPDAERLDVVGGFAQRILDERGATTRLTLTTDRDAAVEQRDAPFGIEVGGEFAGGIMARCFRGGVALGPGFGETARPNRSRA